MKRTKGTEDGEAPVPPVGTPHTPVGPAVWAHAPERYRIFGLGLESAIRLPELPAADLASVELRFALAETAGDAEPAWLHQWRTPDGTQTLACARAGDGYRLRFPDWADFEIDRTCGHIRGLPRPAASPSILRHLLLDQVIPRALAHRGHLVLHASAARLPQGCACFAAPSGAGKSTLASAIGRAGGALLADDAVLLRPGRMGVELVPSYAGLRLWADALEELDRGDTPPRHTRGDSPPKQRLIPEQPIGAQGTGAYALAALFLLAPPTGPSATDIAVQPVGGVEGVAELMQQAFVLDVHDPGFAARHLVSLAEAINAGLRIYRLHYPRDFARLPAVCETIAATLAATR